MKAPKPHEVGAASLASTGDALDYDTVRTAIANDLATSISSTSLSVARLVGDLHDEIQAFLDRGHTYRDVARIFENSGVDASPDAIRVALRRERKKRSQIPPLAPSKRRSKAAAVPTPEEAPARPMGAPAEPSPSSAHEPRADPTPPKVGRHLD